MYGGQNALIFKPGKLISEIKTPKNVEIDGFCMDPKTRICVPNIVTDKNLFVRSVCDAELGFPSAGERNRRAMCPKHNEGKGSAGHQKENGIKGKKGRLHY